MEANMSRNKAISYTKFVHEYIDEAGKVRYAVAEWDENHSQYIAPLDKRTQELTGCFAEFSQKPAGLGGYLSREKALRRARYLFGSSDQQDSN
jgi:hypothetical protein